MKAWRSVTALGLAAGAAVSVAAWGQQGTPSQQPRQREGTRSPSRQDQAPPRQDDRERRDSRDRDRDDRQQQDRDRRDRAFDDDDDDDDRNDRDVDGRRLRDPRDVRQDDPNDRAFRRRGFALADPAREAEFNRSIERLASQERALLQRNQDLLRRLGEARALAGDQRVEALAAVIQDSLLEQERMLQYLADARGAFAGDTSSSGDRPNQDRNNDGAPRQDEMRNDRQTPLEREPDDRGRDGRDDSRDGDRRQPGRSVQPRPTNPPVGKSP